MHITVFGATGAIGSRTVDKMADAAQIDSAVAGADAVVSALGPSMDRKATGLPLVEGTGHIVDAMRRHGIDRCIGQGTPSVRDPREQRTPQSRLVGFMGRAFLRPAYDELQGMGKLVMRPDLRWTTVRFTAPNDKPRVGTVRAGFLGTDRIGFAVSRADIAAFTAAQVDDEAFVRRAPAISALRPRLSSGRAPRRPADAGTVSPCLSTS